MSLQKRDTFQNTIQRTHDFINQADKFESANKHELNERINATKTAFERFQKEHFLLLESPESAGNESIFVAYSKLYECVEETSIKTLARLRERAALLSQNEKATPSTSTQVMDLSEREKDLTEREERINSLKKTIEDRSNALEKEDEMVAEVKEKIERDTKNLDDRKKSLDKQEEQLKNKLKELYAQKASFDEARDHDAKERKERQERFMEKEKALFEYGQRLNEREARLTQSENRALETPSPIPESESPQFSGHFHEFPEWYLQFNQTVHDHEQLPTSKLAKIITTQPPIIQEVIKRWSEQGDDYDQIYANLSLNLRTKCLYVFMMIDGLDSNRSDEQFDGNSVRRMIERAQQVWAYLEPVQSETDNFNLMIVAHLLVTIPQPLRAEWNKTYQSEDMPVLSQVMQIWSEIADKMCGVQRAEADREETADIQSEDVTMQAQSSSAVPNLTSANVDGASIAIDDGTNLMPRTSTPTQRRLACHHCGEEHTMFGCLSYRNMSLKTRWLRVRELDLCANCLSPNHRTGSLSCRAGGCGNCPEQLHNSSLCPVQNATQQFRAATYSANDTPVRGSH